MGHLCLFPRLKDSLSSSPGKQVLQVGPSPSAHGTKVQLGLSSALHFPISSKPRKRGESSPLGSKVTCPRKAVTPGLQLRLPQGTGVFEFPIKPPRPDPSPHICGNKKFPVWRGRCSLLPCPPWDPRRLRGRRGRLHQPQRAKPGKLQRAFRPCRGERQTPTRLSLSQQVPSSPAGADTSAPAAGRRGLRCARWGLPRPPAAWPQLQQLSSALARERRPQPPGAAGSRGAGRGERSGGRLPRGRGGDAWAHEGREGWRGHRQPRGAAHFSCARAGAPPGRPERGCAGRRAGADAERPG